MPVTRKIVGPRGTAFWSSVDPDDIRALREAVKEEFRRSEGVQDIHFNHSGPDHIPPTIRNIRVSFDCFRHCLVFLLRGALFIEGQGMVIEPGYAYEIKDEEWIGLGGNTTILVMEEGEMKGVCSRNLKVKQEKILAEQEEARRKENQVWNRVLTKSGLRKQPERSQCRS
ncbi:hypothetical protein B0T16DRAFT_497832 [Cercophora newfieldiana]|uniref:Uncharacterized protein n=1 Tax=Cercophora newfieldiana TaxID=92897 RepID=A0AA39XU39_9PEZI|nr:hypothetical protein B0T16DRAFT_497832 [Cercophora newfieldiana]